MGHEKAGVNRDIFSFSRTKHPCRDAICGGRFPLERLQYVLELQRATSYDIISA